MIYLVCVILAGIFAALWFGFYIKSNLGDGNLSFIAFVLTDLCLLVLISMFVDRFVFQSKKLGRFVLHESGVKALDFELPVHRIQSLEILSHEEVKFNGLLIRYWKNSTWVKVVLDQGEQWEGRIGLKAKETKLELHTVLLHYCKLHNLKIKQ